MTTIRLTPISQPARNHQRPTASPCARLDADDMARVVAGFRAQRGAVAGMRYSRGSADGDAAVYVTDADSGMVYLVD